MASEEKQPGFLGNVLVVSFPGTLESLTKYLMFR